ncbi:hypothetical protein [Bradyrhizobium sp. Ghvi]|uniref:hypothetical protein n=1 Tax=Bradyrhizobium sp. Ghvi TaxID=1855319 RepID=UPI001178CD84|nr:hypothetical protein [Bradyrhizobium sp. Ghvi]
MMRAMSGVISSPKRAAFASIMSIADASTGQNKTDRARYEALAIRGSVAWFDYMESLQHHPQALDDLLSQPG